MKLNKLEFKVDWSAFELRGFRLLLALLIMFLVGMSVAFFTEQLFVTYPNCTNNMYNATDMFNYIGYNATLII